MGAVCDCVRNEDKEYDNEIISIHSRNEYEKQPKARAAEGALYDDRFGSTHLSDENIFKNDYEEIRGTATTKGKYNNYDANAIEEANDEEDGKIVRAPVLADENDVKNGNRGSKKQNVIVEEDENHMDEFHQINVVSSSHDAVIQSQKKKHDTYQFKNPNMKKSPANKDKPTDNTVRENNEQVLQNQDRQVNSATKNKKTGLVDEKEIKESNGVDEELNENEEIDEGILIYLDDFDWHEHSKRVFNFYNDVRKNPFKAKNKLQNLLDSEIVPNDQIFKTIEIFNEIVLSNKKYKSCLWMETAYNDVVEKLQNLNKEKTFKKNMAINMVGRDNTDEFYFTGKYDIQTTLLLFLIHNRTKIEEILKAGEATICINQLEDNEIVVNALHLHPEEL